VASAYEILGVPRDAAPEEIRRAYRTRARTTHPDRAGGDPESFLAIRAAYEILADPDRRRAHDVDPEGTFGSQLEIERRKGQLRRRRERLRRLYE
jgi:molecular chaperone DnaJ